MFITAMVITRMYLHICLEQGVSELGNLYNRLYRSFAGIWDMLVNVLMICRMVGSLNESNRISLFT